MEIIGAILLSVEEANQLDEKTRRASCSWWLRSPGNDVDIAAFVYGEDGFIFDYGEIVDDLSFGVRPALEINDLKSSNLKIGNSIAFGDHNFTIISERYALCNDMIGRCAFRKNWKAEDANSYEASDVKKYVDDWFIRIKEKIKRQDYEESVNRTATNKSLSDYDDNESDWVEIISENTELLLDFIEEHLEDFVGFDPYADTTGYDLQRAWNEKETYVYSLSDETIMTLADEIRKRREDFYCEEGEIVDRRIREAEKEAETNKEQEEIEQ